MRLFRMSLLPLFAIVVLAHSSFSFANGNFKLNAAGAFFKTTDASGCIETTIDISGQRQVGNGATTPLVETFIHRRDTCQGIDLIRASESGDQHVEIEAHSLFRFDVHGSVTIFDFVTQQSYVMDVDLAWVGQGNITTTNSPNQHSQIRDATAKGRILFNGGNLATDGSSSASIEQIKTHSN